CRAIPTPLATKNTIVFEKKRLTAGGDQLIHFMNVVSLHDSYATPTEEMKSSRNRTCGYGRFCRAANGIHEHRSNTFRINAYADLDVALQRLWNRHPAGQRTRRFHSQVQGTHAVKRL